MPSPPAVTSLEVAVPVVMIFHDSATLKQPDLTFTGSVVKDGTDRIYVTFSSGVEVRGIFPSEKIQNSESGADLWREIPTKYAMGSSVTHSH